MELGRCTLGSLALGADLHAGVPRHWLLTAGTHDEASTFLFDGHSGQQYELLTYQALAGKPGLYVGQLAGYGPAGKVAG